jgi:uncharacterized protein (DUF2249 family)
MKTSLNEYLDANGVLDVRTVPCSIKHGLILQTWRDLPVGDSFTLRNGHDPVPLRYQIEAEYPGALQWDYVARSADDVSVKLTKVREVVAAAGAGAGSCAGH